MLVFTVVYLLSVEQHIENFLYVPVQFVCQVHVKHQKKWLVSRLE